ncbi:IucA/IucC family protein [Rossellomorea sp. GCM10028870]|uniref:IucA/IucC family protein n=1 Tax=Rossellomorea sp. GCM10028870 TaxID=3273426 RepID=UPI00361DC572
MTTLSSHQRIFIKETDVQKILKEKLPISQKRILHKLVQAIVREKVIDYTEETSTNDVKLLYIKPSHNIIIKVPIKHTYALGHMDIEDPITIEKENTVHSINTPSQLIEELIEGRTSESGNLKQLKIELENSVTNDALALTAEKLRRGGSIAVSTLRYLQQGQSSNASFSPLTFLEQMVIEGHTLHPCSKTRLGLSKNEVMMYAPEWGNKVDIIPLAIHKSISSFSKITDGPSMTDVLLKDYPYLEEAFKGNITRLHLVPDEYELIPVHPWQFEHTVKKHYRTELKQKLLIPIDTAIPYQPLISFRSLAPNNRTHHHIKTALNVQMTSAKRIVSPTSVRNGPVISEMLDTISKHDLEIRNKINFLSESSGGHYQSLQKGASLNLEKNLSALIRENPEKNLTNEEIAVPGASLINTSPVTGKVLVVELIEEWSKRQRISTENAAARFIQKYASTLTPGLISLIVKYGISLEAHLQNALIIFENGTPTKLSIRDNGGIRILEDRTRTFIEKGRISNETNLLTTEPLDLYKVFSHAVIHNHLGEIIVRITKELKISETLLWQQVSDVIQSTMDDLKSQELHKENAAHFEQELYSTRTYLKSLIKMRLSDTITENMYVSAPNPLIQGGKENTIETV